MLEGRKEDEPDRTPADLIDGIHQSGEFGAVSCGAIDSAFEGGGHSVGEDGDGGFGDGDLFLDALEPFGVRLVPVEAGAGAAGGAVGGPGEIAEGDIAVGEATGEGGFEMAVVAFAFEEGVAEEHHTVALAQFQIGGVKEGEQQTRQPCHPAKDAAEPGTGGH